MKEILDFLQTVYPVRLDPKDVPSILRPPFNHAVNRFQNPAELKGLDRSKLGICEEVADVTYQVLKLVCLEKNILNDKTIRTLDDYLLANKHYDSEKMLVGFDYLQLDALSVKLVPDALVNDLRAQLPDVMFTPGKDNGLTIVREFLGGQFVAYISRIWRGHAMGGLQAVEHMKDRKIPEEVRELIEAMIKSTQKLSGRELLEELEHDLESAENLRRVASEFQYGGSVNHFFSLLAHVLKWKMAKPVTIEDTLHLMFLKMKGRQELDFLGVPEQQMRYICKPVEYLVEADMFL